MKIGLSFLFAMGSLLAVDDDAFLKQDARAAEKAGDVVRAYLLYSQAAALNPKDSKAWGKALSLRTRAAKEALVMPTGPAPNAATDAGLPDLEPPSEKDLMESKVARAPLRLQPGAGSHSFHLKGDSKKVAESVLKAYGIEVIFDGDYQATQNVRFDLDDVEFLDAATAVQAATGTFLVPVSEKIAMAAKDTTQKRQELEHTMAIAIPLPSAISVQDVQELARSVQQLFEIIKFNVDSTHRIVLIRDRESKVVPAAALFKSLIRYRAEVYLEVEFLESSESYSRTLGLQLPTEFPISLLTGKALALNFTPIGWASFGLTIANSQLLASFTKSHSRTLSRAEMRGAEGTPVQFHLGDKYPILSTGYFGATAAPGQTSYTPPPTFNFEDLGVVLKITPHVHGTDEISMEIEAEYKVLTGKASNGIPVIATRKFVTSARLKTGESAVIAGLLRSNDARSLSGIAGLASLPALGPVFRNNTKSHDSGEAMFVIRPRIVAPSPGEVPVPTLYTGTDTKPHIPL